MKRRLALVFLVVIILVHSLLISCNYSTKDSEKTYNSIKNPKTLKVHFINVGQGDSILIEVNGYTVLIDAGPNSSSSKLKAYLDKNAITKLDYIIATHPDEDHIGSMDDIIKNYEVGSFYAPKATKNTETFKSMVKELRNKDLKINVAAKGMALDLGDDVNFDVLSPIDKSYEDINNFSVVVKLIYGETSLLFMGDAENLVESQLMRDKVDIDSDVLKLGHHGSSSSTSSKFLKEVSPDFAIISVGKDNKYNHPHKETMDKLKKEKIQIYRTDVYGTVILSSDGSNITMDQAK